MIQVSNLLRRSIFTVKVIHTHKNSHIRMMNFWTEILNIPTHFQIFSILRELCLVPSSEQEGV